MNPIIRLVINTRGGALNRVSPTYIALGLFKDREDIKNSPSQEAIMPNIKPGI